MSPAIKRNLDRQREALKNTIALATAALESLPPIPSDTRTFGEADCQALLDAAEAADDAVETQVAVRDAAEMALASAQNVAQSAWAEYEQNCIP